MVEVTTGGVGAEIGGVEPDAGELAWGASGSAGRRRQRLRPVFSISPSSLSRCKADRRVAIGLAERGPASCYSR